MSKPVPPPIGYSLDSDLFVKRMGSMRKLDNIEDNAKDTRDRFKKLSEILQKKFEKREQSELQSQG